MAEEGNFLSQTSRVINSLVGHLSGIEVWISRLLSKVGFLSIGNLI